MNENHPKLNETISIMAGLLGELNPWKIVLSKPREKNYSTKSITITPVIRRDQLSCKCVFREEKKDVTGIETVEDFVHKLPTRLLAEFYNADIFTETETYQFLQNQNGKSTLLTKKKPNVLASTFTHDHQKKSYVNAEAGYYRALGLVSGTGQVFSKGQKKYNQVNKYLEIMHHLLDGKTVEMPFRIVDMGSGKAYLTFAAYDFFRNHKGWDVHITGYEARPDLVQSCNEIALNSGMENLFFEAKSIDEIPAQPTDMVIALHACDIATDMAIAYGVQNDATYIILAPCCQKQVRKAMDIPEVLLPLLKHGILLERQAELLTDGLRALILEYHGYQTKVFEFISQEHTRKNVMIIAEKGKKNPAARQAFEDVKSLYGITFHYLEKILPFS